MTKFFIEDCWGNDGRKVLKVKSPLGIMVHDFSTCRDAFNAAVMLYLIIKRAVGKKAGEFCLCETREEFNAKDTGDDTTTADNADDTAPF